MQLWLALIFGVVIIAALFSSKVTAGVVIVSLRLGGCLQYDIFGSSQGTVEQASILPVDERNPDEGLE